jgi:hypothetical protein
VRFLDPRAEAVFLAGVAAFSQGDSGAAYRAFDSLFSQSEFPNQRSTFGSCVSAHSSEHGCATKAAVSFNRAVVALNLAAAVDTGPTHQRLYLTRALGDVEQALLANKDDDHVKGLQQLLTFLLLDAEVLLARMSEKASVSVRMAIGGDNDSSVGGDDGGGGGGGGGEFTEVKIKVGYCDDVGATALSFCGTYNIGSADCTRIKRALMDDLHATVFPYSLVPFDLTSPSSSSREGGEGSRSTAFWSVPPCLRGFPNVLLLQSCPSDN